MRDGEPWWVLADVCRMLETGNPSMAASRLDEVSQSTVGRETRDQNRN
jgi:prophage antirepressor-like protein